MTACGEMEMCPLVAAIDGRDVPAVAELLSRGADPDTVEPLTGDPLIVCAARAGDCASELVGLLLGAGADPKATDSDNHPVLFTSVLACDEAVFMMLIENGADPFARDGGGNSLLHVAAWVGMDCAVSHLVALGTSPGTVNKKGGTPLHLAAGSRRPGAGSAALLVSLGADIDARDAGGCTPLWIAAWQGNRGFCEAALTLGADPRIPDHLGGTPAERAGGRRHTALAELLRSASESMDLGESVAAAGRRRAIPTVSL